MSLVSGSIARPVTVTMATIAVVLFGSISLDRLGLNLLPELNYPTLTVRTEFEGAAPAEVEEQITRRLEQRLGSGQRIAQDALYFCCRTFRCDPRVCLGHQYGSYGD